jgi:hypothetical protein
LDIEGVTFAKGKNNECGVEFIPIGRKIKPKAIGGKLHVCLRNYMGFKTQDGG